jgi:hypothetical protein
MAGRWLSSIAVLLALAPWHSSQGEPVRVYRCTAADGAVSLQDAPCPKTDGQELRMLRRPVDGPAPAPVATPPPIAEVRAPPPEPPVPREPTTPLYDCVAHDGSTYESTTGVGEMRWVPLWVLGLDPRAPARTFVRTGATPSPPRSAPRAPSRVPDPASMGAGTWVQDQCWMLSPGEACARRHDQLMELRRDRKDAQANERVRLRAEADDLSAQLARQCQ